MPIEFTCTYGGGRDNDDGKMWFKVIAPMDQMRYAIRCVNLHGKQVHLFAYYDSSVQQLGTFTYNGLVDTPDGEIRVSFRSDVHSVNSEKMAELKSMVAGQKSFNLAVWTIEEVQKALEEEGTKEDDAATEETELTL
jgi:hypothetical protein